MVYRLSKDFRFEAAHQLVGHDGKCARRHGHSWVARVTVKGDALRKEGPKRGMLIDYADLSLLVKPLVEEYLDHWDLNETLKTDRPTSEFVAAWLWGELQERLDLARHGASGWHAASLESVVIEETCTSRCEVRE